MTKALNKNSLDDATESNLISPEEAADLFAMMSGAGNSPKDKIKIDMNDSSGKSPPEYETKSQPISPEEAAKMFAMMPDVERNAKDKGNATNDETVLGTPLGEKLANSGDTDTLMAFESAETKRTNAHAPAGNKNEIATKIEPESKRRVMETDEDATLMAFKSGVAEAPTKVSRGAPSATRPANAAPEKDARPAKPVKAPAGGKKARDQVEISLLANKSDGPGSTDKTKLLPPPDAAQAELTIAKGPKPGTALTKQRGPMSSGSGTRAGFFIEPGVMLGEYRIVKELGRGAMGIVYEAVQEGLRRRVALKILPAEVATSAQAVERFKREAASAAKLQHENIVPVYGMGEFMGIHYFAMEFVKGRSLEDLLDAIRNSTEEVGWDRICKIIVQAARGLAYAHRHRIIHRDIKPANIMLEQGDKVMIADFGLAREQDQATITKSGQIMGTPAYMSPEQAEATKGAVGPHSDQYSLGVCLYEMLTAGERPFRGATIHEVLMRVLEEEPMPPRKLRKIIPKDLETICLKSIEKVSEKRYATCDTFAEDLESYLSGKPISARPIGALGRTYRRAVRHKLLTTLICFFVITIAFAAAFGVKWFLDEQDREANFNLALQAGEQSFKSAEDAQDLEQKLKFFEEAKRHYDEASRLDPKSAEVISRQTLIVSNLQQVSARAEQQRFEREALVTRLSERKQSSDETLRRASEAFSELAESLASGDALLEELSSAVLPCPDNVTHPGYKDFEDRAPELSALVTGMRTSLDSIERDVTNVANETFELDKEQAYSLDEYGAIRDRHSGLRSSLGGLKIDVNEFASRADLFQRHVLEERQIAKYLSAGNASLASARANIGALPESVDGIQMWVSAKIEEVGETASDWVTNLRQDYLSAMDKFEVAARQPRDSYDEALQKFPGKVLPTNRRVEPLRLKFDAAYELALAALVNNGYDLASTMLYYAGTTNVDNEKAQRTEQIVRDLQIIYKELEQIFRTGTDNVSSNPSAAAESYRQVLGAMPHYPGAKEGLARALFNIPKNEAFDARGTKNYQTAWEKYIEARNTIAEAKQDGLPITDENGWEQEVRDGLVRTIREALASGHSDVQPLQSAQSPDWRKIRIAAVEILEFVQREYAPGEVLTLESDTERRSLRDLATWAITAREHLETPQGMKLYVADDYRGAYRNLPAEFRSDLPADFYLKVNEVTNAEFQQFVDAGMYSAEHIEEWQRAGVPDAETLATFVSALDGLPGPMDFQNSHARIGFERHPVSGIGYFEAVCYVNWLNAKTGNSYRLPRPHEWQIGARWQPGSGNAPLISFTFQGGKFDPEFANLTQQGPSAVGSYPQDVSPTGILDVTGNVSEWLEDGRAMGGAFGSGGALAQRNALLERVASPGKNARSLRFGFRLAMDPMPETGFDPEKYLGE
ncbi:MAG: protein kinase [Planctomycetes bacterium]|nr:protein kinase [Planctomycetota bacterium]